MRLKYLTVLLGGLALAACESTSDDVGSAQGAGSASNKAAGAGASSGQVSSRSLSAPQPGSQEDLVVNVGDRVFFGLDRYDLNADSRAALEKQAAWMRKYGNVAVSIEGHANERGTREYNLALGERRATAVKNYLTALGIAPGRVESVSFGKECPVALGSSEAAWAQNRRSVSVVNRGGAASACAPSQSRR